MSEKIDREKAIQLARDFLKLSAEKEADTAYLEEDNDEQYWWVTFKFPATNRFFPPYNYLIVRVNEMTGKVEPMPSI